MAEMKIVKAQGFVARLIGWLGRRKACPDEALWLVPCRGVHTLGMRFPIDLVFLDRSGRVLRIDESVKPWRCRWHGQAHSVVELKAGGAAARGVTLGTRLRHTRGVDWNALTTPAPMAFLPAVLALLIGMQVDPCRAGAPLLEDPSVPEPVTIPFQPEWKADPERLYDALPTATPSGGSAAGPALASPVNSRALLGPIHLLRPLAPETITRLLDEAESLYRGRQWVQALEAYRSLIELDPRNRTAWLRMGNLHHQRNQLASAASAYRKAAQLPAPAPEAGGFEPATREATEVRAKALANLAVVNLELARESLNELQTLRMPVDSVTAGIRDTAAAEWRQLDQSVRTLDAAAMPARASPSMAPGASGVPGGPAFSGPSGAAGSIGDRVPAGRSAVRG
ncbi:MAG: DUF192 domain-containing protein, partial [Burkholderiaceae bacterium]|nr:DUF192 domain-containing protein [Burkholderiaceae bacterium]